MTADKEKEAAHAIIIESSILADSFSLLLERISVTTEPDDPRSTWIRRVRTERESFISDVLVQVLCIGHPCGAMIDDQHLRSLIETYGVDSAAAFIDGLVCGWKMREWKSSEAEGG